MAKLTFLGTSSMVPTKERNHVSCLLNYEDENILIDCGEGTQRQIKIANISPTKITKILISHWHGDHILGLPGLLQTMAASQYNKQLEIYGPKGSSYFMKKIMEIFIHDNKLNIKLTEITKDGKFFENKKFYLEAKKLKHSTDCIGFSLIEKDKRKINVPYLKKFNLKNDPIIKNLQNGKSIKFKGKFIDVKKATSLVKGKKITFITDTVYCNECILLAKNADLLVCESTFDSKLEQNAKDFKHLTAKQASLIAKKAKVKKLILTHFSQRYNNIDILKKEAKQIFKDVIFAHDFLVFEL